MLKILISFFSMNLFIALYYLLIVVEHRLKEKSSWKIDLFIFLSITSVIGAVVSFILLIASIISCIISCFI